MSEESSKPNGLFIALAFVTAFVSIFSAVLMTEPGQSLNLPCDWVFGYHSNKWLFIILNLGLLAALWFMHIKYRIWGKIWMSLASLGVIFCIISANFLLPAFFPS